MTQSRSREETIQKDVADLHRLGYAQELFRSMGGFSNFAISFSIISILTGAVILYDYGLAWAGTAASLIGWPLITIFVLCIAATIITPLTGGAYSNTTVFFGDPAFGAEGPALSGALVTMAALLVVELALNIAGVRVVALLNQVSVWWHIFFVIVIAGALFILGTK